MELKEVSRSNASLIEDFIRELANAENSRDISPLVQLFSPTAELRNLTKPRSHTHPHAHGARARDHESEGSLISAEKFWHQYLHAFDQISSKIVSKTVIQIEGPIHAPVDGPMDGPVDKGEMAVLEWHSSGVLSMGLPIQYAGVSLLECRGGQIQSFRTYYDSAAFLPHAAHGLISHHSATAGLPDSSPQISS